MRDINRLVKQLGRSLDIGVVETQLAKLVVFLDKREFILLVVEDEQLLLRKILDGFYPLLDPGVITSVNLVNLIFGVDQRLCAVPRELSVGSLPEALRLVDAVDRDGDGVLDLGIDEENRIFSLPSVQVIVDRRELDTVDHRKGPALKHGPGIREDVAISGVAEVDA